MAALAGKTDSAPYMKMRQTIFATRTVEKYASHLISHLKPNFHVLDVGSGPGSITLGLARLVPQGHVIGLDIHVPDLDGARKVAKEEGVTNVEFVEGDAHNIFEILKEHEGKFDVVHSHMCVMYLRNPVDVLKQLRRLLKQGGVLAIADSCTVHRVPDPGDRFQEERAVFKKITEKRGGRPDAGFVNHSWVNQAGWSWDQIQSGTNSWEFSGEEGRRMMYLGAKGSQKKTAIEEGLTTEEEQDEVAKRWDTWVEDPNGRFMGLDGWVMAWT